MLYKQRYACSYNSYIILININNFISEIMLYHHYINYYLLYDFMQLKSSKLQSVILVAFTNPPCVKL